MWQCLWWPSVFDLMLSWKDMYVLQSFSPSPIGIDTFFVKTISISQGWIVQSALNLSVTFINDTGIQCNAVKYIKQCIIKLLLCSCEFASRKKKKKRDLFNTSWWLPGGGENVLLTPWSGQAMGWHFLFLLSGMVFAGLARAVLPQIAMPALWS